MTMQPAPRAQPTRPEWQTEMIRLVVLYLLVECRQKLPLSADSTKDVGLIEHELGEMCARGLIKHDGSYWYATDESDDVAMSGKSALAKVVAMFDHLMKFEIFGGVRLERDLTEDERLDDNPSQCRDHVYDPRFVGPTEEDPNATDMRIAMITYLSEQMSYELGGQKVDPHRVVFLQKLASGRFKAKDFWFELRLGTFFREVEAIVASVYQWRDIVPGDEAQASFVMQILYTAGMLEQRKRDGSKCSSCHIPLAVFELGASQNGETLHQCPNPGCGASYDPPVPKGAAEECPACHSDIYPNQRTCVCGAIIDRRYRAGSVNEQTVATTEVVDEAVYDPYWNSWGYGYGYYGYAPYGYYDPWNPFVDVVAFGCLCAILW